MDMWNEDFRDGDIPFRRCFEVDFFLEDPGVPFGGVVDEGEGGDVGETSDAVETGGAEVSFTGYFGVDFLVALSGESGGGGEECSCIFWAGAVVDVFLECQTVS